MPKQEKPIKEYPPSCRGCQHWDRFGDKCWYYWELKKHCTMHSDENKPFGMPAISDIEKE